MNLGYADIHKVKHVPSGFLRAVDIFTYLSSGEIYFPGGSDGKVSAHNAGDLGSTPGLGRSPGEGNGNPLQYLAWKIPWMEES